MYRHKMYVAMVEAGVVVPPASGGAAPAAAAPVVAAPAAAAPVVAAPAAAAPVVAAPAAAAPVVEDLSQKPTLLNKDVAAAPAEPSLDDQRKFLTERAKTDADKQALTGKTEDEIKKLFGEAKAADAAEAAKPVDPASYLKDLKLPDGFELDKDLSGKFLTMAAKGKVPAAEVQAFLQEYAKNTLEAAKAPYRLWQAKQEEWSKAIREDKEIGGANLDANLAHAKRFINALPNAVEVRAALDFTGAGNHPAVVKAFIAAGKMIAEGTIVNGAPAGASKSAASVMYPKMAEQQAASGS